MLTAEEIIAIVRSGEGFNAEFKVRVPLKVKELSEEICAFANAAGGIIIIGVDDNNIIRGFTIDNLKRSAIQNSIGEITPRINCTLEIIEVDGLDVGIIEVPSGKNKPYVLSGAIFVRIGPNSQKLTTAEEMRGLFQQSDKIYFDEGECKGFVPEVHLDVPNFKVFRTDAMFHASLTDIQILQNLQLFTAEHTFKNGSVLFFGKNPETFFEQAIVRCIAFQGNDKRYISDDQKFGGPVYQQYLQAMNWLRGKMKIAYDIENQGGGHRLENWEIPQTVFKEAIINALSHRDYYEKGAVTTIEVFDDRVEISNPGGLLSAISKDFGRRSLSRNPLVFGLFERMHLVEKVGSGIPRMQELMHDIGLPSPTYRTEGMFTIVLARSIPWEIRRHELSKGVSKNQLMILDMIHNNNKITIPNLSKSTGLSETAIENNIRKLKESLLLQRIGTRKDGAWKIV